MRVDARAPRGQGRAIARRAEALIGEEYDLVRFNCEHAANLAATGKSFSTQVQAVLGVGVLAVLGIGGALLFGRR